jgi:hypothetical protein
VNQYPLEQEVKLLNPVQGKQIAIGWTMSFFQNAGNRWVPLRKRLLICIPFSAISRSQEQSSQLNNYRLKVGRLRGD